MSLSPTQLLRTLESFVSPLFPSHSTFNTSALALHLNLATLSHLHWFYPWSSHYCLFPGALGQLPYSFLDSILNPQQPTVHTAARVMFRKNPEMFHGFTMTRSWKPSAQLRAHQNYSNCLILNLHNCLPASPIYFH